MPVDDITPPDGVGSKAACSTSWATGVLIVHSKAESKAAVTKMKCIW